jgi:hypothetical protein
MSFVLLQGIGIMPLQLLNVGSLFWIGVYRTLFRLTPRGESNASWMYTADPS